MLIVAAIGGNALVRRGERPEAEIQRRNIRKVALPLAELARDHRLLITHGNGPQIGLLALEAESYKDVHPYPLDMLGAESQGLVGYLLQESLSHLIPQKTVAALVTRVLVDESDPAFKAPRKPIGPVYTKEIGERLARERGWRVAPDGLWWRRVVPSPQPRKIVDLSPIRTLAGSDAIVICAGGGGVPVVETNDGLRGVEAVIDKDLTSSLLAIEMDADLLLILTDVESIAFNWGLDSQRWLRHTTPSELRSMEFASGSMAPKVEGACRFVEATGKPAIIGPLGDPSGAIGGRIGTKVSPE